MTLGHDGRPLLTAEEAFCFLADITAEVDKVPRKSITLETTISLKAFRQFNIHMRARTRTEYKMPPSLIHLKRTTIADIVAQLKKKGVLK